MIDFYCEIYVFAEHNNLPISFFIFADSIHLFILILKDKYS